MISCKFRNKRHVAVRETGVRAKRKQMKKLHRRIGESRFRRERGYMLRQKLKGRTGTIGHADSISAVDSKNDREKANSGREIEELLRG